MMLALVILASIGSASDLVFVNGVNCYGDYSQPLHTGASITNLNAIDAYWLSEAVLERKSAISSVSTFPIAHDMVRTSIFTNYPNALPNQPNESSVIAEKWTELLSFIPNATSFRKCVVNPSLVPGIVIGRNNDTIVSILQREFGAYVHPNGGWWATGRFADVGVELRASKALNGHALSQSYSNLVDATAFIPCPTDISGTSVNANIIAQAASSQAFAINTYNAAAGYGGNEFPGALFGYIEYGWFDPVGGTLTPSDYKYRIQKVVANDTGTSKYVVGDVPPGASVKLYAAWTYTWTSYVTGTNLVTMTLGEQVAQNTRLEPVATKHNQTVRNVINIAFTEKEIADAIALRATAYINNVFTTCGAATEVPKSQAMVRRDVSGARVGYPRKFSKYTILSAYVIPRISLGDHTKWW